ncbi:MAG TPA: hypothetical protein VM121_02745 [Acidimicrobiales bacterium]|nr:hypothetical protein [Acidimicrobiales bacterium]
MSESGEPSPPPVGAPERNGFMQAAAIAIEAAMVLILVAGLITALAFDLTERVEEWKVRAKLMSLSGQGLYGFTGIGGAVLIAVAVLVALGLARAGRNDGGGGRSSTIGAVAVAISLWLGLLIVVGIYVDLTEIDQADLAIATALGDLATLVMLVVAGWWGLAMAGDAKR